jgi:DNA-binding transcriptional regulator GbsR (MarR family)
MDAETVRWGVTGFLALIAYFAKRAIDENKDNITGLKQDLQNVKRDYLHRDDFKEFKAELRGMFDEIKADIKALRDGA